MRLMLSPANRYPPRTVQHRASSTGLAASSGQAVPFGGFFDRVFIGWEKFRHPASKTPPDFETNWAGVVTNNDLYLRTLMALLESAKHSIKIDCFYIGGNAGEQIIALLEKKAAQGVKIYYRGDMNSGLENKSQVSRAKVLLNTAQLRLARRFFYTEHHRRDPFQMVGVNHNKTFIVDNHLAMVSSKNPCEGNMKFRDTSIVLKGPAVQAMVKEFNRSWRKKTGIDLAEEDSKQPISSDPGSIPSSLRALMVPQSCRPLITSATKKHARQAMLSLIQEARESIDLHGFCLTSREVIEALKEAVRQGKTVRILLDSRDHGWVRLPNGTAFRELTAMQQQYPNLSVRAYKHQDMQQGTHTKRTQYLYQNHNKMLVADRGARAILGSTNFTNSDLWNQENTSVELLYSPQLVERSSSRQLAGLFEDDWKHHSRSVRPLGPLETFCAVLASWVFEF